MAAKDASHTPEYSARTRRLRHYTPSAKATRLTVVKLVVLFVREHILQPARAPEMPAGTARGGITARSEALTTPRPLDTFPRISRSSRSARRASNQVSQCSERETV